MQLMPEPGHLIVRQDKPDDTSEGGIVLPDEVKQRPLTGTVVKESIETNLTVEGQRVLFSPYAGISTEVTGEELLILRREDILAVLVGKDA